LNGPRRQLVVLARWPAVGRCKRRLAADLHSARRAAAVQRQLTDHTLRTAAAACAATGAELLLAVEGLGPRGRRRWGLALGRRGIAATLVGQGNGSLGCRMQRQWRLEFGAGAEQVVLIGSDLPALERADLERAFSALEQRPLVLGPASDGGYWLIGLNRDGFTGAGPSLMAGIPWGSDRVLAATLERAQRRQLSPALLRRLSDLDTRADLAPWLRRHQVAPAGR
jgi:rSAM/selenodomain-associated transferase 1